MSTNDSEAGESTGRGSVHARDGVAGEAREALAKRILAVAEWSHPRAPHDALLVVEVAIAAGWSPPAAEGRSTVGDAITAWEEHGPTSLTVALMADALYGVQESTPPATEGATVSALRELVRLKDGPRDDAYRAAKEAAWDRARAVLANQTPALGATVSEEAAQALYELRSAATSRDNEMSVEGFDRAIAALLHLALPAQTISEEVDSLHRGVPVFAEDVLRDLVERSSLGTPEAKAAREATPPPVAQEIVRRSNEQRATVPPAQAVSEEARRLLEYALHLRTYGENAPGGNETWRQFDFDCETYLRSLTPPAPSPSPSSVEARALSGEHRGRRVRLPDGWVGRLVELKHYGDVYAGRVDMTLEDTSLHGELVRGTHLLHLAPSDVVEIIQDPTEDGEE